MQITILVPHWETGKMTAYAVSQLLKFKGSHDLDIVVIDNHEGDGSTKYLDPFIEHVTIVAYPSNLMQSHGIAFDYVLPHIRTNYFITIESDSFPTKEGWLDYYEDLIHKGYESAGSLLKLSGGSYMHPCGALYKKSNWLEAKKYCDAIPYAYFPNMAPNEGFDCHLMVHNLVLDKFLDAPEDYIDISNKYKPYTKELALEKLEWYKPTRGPFHNGMGFTEESVRSYGIRSIGTDAAYTNLNGAKKLIRRIGFEPGQWLSYWQEWAEKRIFYIPTETKWINDKIGYQQEYTIMENGFKHLWGVSAYKDVDPQNEVAKIKQALPEQLYATLPLHQKIKE